MTQRSIIESLEGRQLLSAKISVTANGAGIAAGDNTPARTDYTDFGPAALSGTGGVVTRSYTVKNTGTTTITFTSPRTGVGGEDVGQFKITKGLPKSLAKGKSATFTVQFDPSSEGTQKANVSITSNASKKVYRFDVQGTGLKTTAVGSAGLQVATTKTGTGSAAKKGQVLEMNYTGYLLDGKKFDSSLNTGRTPFQFTSEIGQVITGWQQGLAGTKVGDKKTLFIPASMGYGSAGSGTSIPGNATLIFETETLRIGDPSVKITGNNKTISDGDSTPRTEDNTDFGSVAKGKTVTKTFRIAADLFESGQQFNVSAVTWANANAPLKITGTNAKDFTVGALTNNGDGTLSFTVTFKPSATGSRSANIELAYKSASRSPTTGTDVYTSSTTLNFEIQGRGI